MAALTQHAARTALTSTCAAAALFACSSPSTSDEIGISRQSLTVNEFTAVANAGVNYAESAGSAFQNSSGVWEFVASEFFNAGCTRDGFATWCPQPTSLGGSDPTFVFRNPVSLLGSSLGFLRTSDEDYGALPGRLRHSDME